MGRDVEEVGGGKVRGRAGGRRAHNPKELWARRGNPPYGKQAVGVLPHDPRQEPGDLHQCAGRGAKRPTSRFRPSPTSQARRPRAVHAPVICRSGGRRGEERESAQRMHCCRCASAVRCGYVKCGVRSPGDEAGSTGSRRRRRGRPGVVDTNFQLQHLPSPPVAHAYLRTGTDSCFATPHSGPEGRRHLLASAPPLHVSGLGPKAVSQG